MAGLVPPQILRIPGEDPAAPGPDITVELADDGSDTPELDENNNVLRIDHGDGSVTVSLDGRPIGEANDNRKTGWFANLVDQIGDGELGRIANDLLRGIEDDLNTRKDWIEDRALGLKLLGLRIELPGLQGASEGAPVEGMSKVRHPLLLEAVLRFQANARSELLPTDGPVKVRDDSNGDTAEHDRLGDALEQDLNHYLTAVASEYYPDTDRMLLMLGFGGTQFKKVYQCPLRNRPVSETVDADDLIVNNAATDLRNAKRITHRVYMRPSTVKRLQILGVYRDIQLSQPMAPKMDSFQREEKAQQGVSVDTMNPEDRDREIYECYCELDIVGFEHEYKGKPSGLEIPYRVTIDVSTQQILSVTRNYDEETKELPEARATFVKYTFVPGLGFLDIGLLHILGNTTNAITAAWREMLDNGMFANFPGFLRAKGGGARQLSNIFRIPPGGAADIETNGNDIRASIMPLPYNTQQMAPLMALTQDMATTGMRIGGTSEQQVGEGRADAPVGTTLAMIEQATKVLNAVHKRMHAAQAEEFKLLVTCFREHPESFVGRKYPSKIVWDEATFLKALNDCELVPQADPNTASHGQRVMKIMALKQLQASNPSMYDPIAIDTAALQAIGWSNPQQFFAPPSAQQQPPPELLEIQAKMKADQTRADAATMTAQARLIDAKAKGLAAGQTQQPSSVDAATAQAKLIDAKSNAQTAGLRAHEIQVEDQNRDLDRRSRERLEVMQLSRDIMLHPANNPQPAVEKAKKVEREVGG